MMDRVRIGKHRVQERGPRLDVGKDLAHYARGNIQLLAGKGREIQDLRGARDVDALRRALAADERQAR